VTATMLALILGKTGTDKNGIGNNGTGNNGTGNNGTGIKEF